MSSGKEEHQPLWCQQALKPLVASPSEKNSPRGCILGAQAAHSPSGDQSAAASVLCSLGPWVIPPCLWDWFLLLINCVDVGLGEVSGFFQLWHMPYDVILTHTDTHKHTQTHTNTQRGTQKQTRTHTHRNTHRDIHRHNHTDTHRHVQKNTHTNTQTHRCTHRHTHSHTTQCIQVVTKT